MRQLTYAEHLAAEHLAAAYRGALVFVTALNDVPPYAVRESAELQDEVLRETLATLTSRERGLASQLAREYAPVKCSRPNCGNVALDKVWAVTDTDPYCSRECLQWVRRDRARAARHNSANHKR